MELLQKNELCYIIKHPFLNIGIFYIDDSVTRISLVPSIKYTSIKKLPPKINTLKKELLLWLDGESINFSVFPDLSLFTAFEQDIFKACFNIPWGNVLSYGELGIITGYPKSARAVGNVMHKNRYLLLIPCHRVVAVNGIGGYGLHGTELKRKLLKHEGIIKY